MPTDQAFLELDFKLNRLMGRIFQLSICHNEIKVFFIGRFDMSKLKCVTAVLLCMIILTAGCAQDESQSATTQLAGGNQTPESGAKGEQQQSSSDGASESQVIEPKQLISREEAAQLIGEAVRDGADEEQEALGMKICFYAAENIDSKGYLQITVIQQAALSKGSSEEKTEEGGSGGEENAGGSGGSEKQGGSGGSGQGGGGELSPKDIFEALKKALKDQNAPDPGRIGDDIFLSAQGMGIMLGEYCIFVAAGSSDPAKVSEIVKMAGELAVRNLKRIQGK